jgi:hypothetical protein
MPAGDSYARRKEPRDPQFSAFRPPAYRHRRCPNNRARPQDAAKGPLARRRRLNPGLLTNYDAREAVKAASPSEHAPAAAWTHWVLNVLLAYFSRSVCAERLGVYGRILKGKSHVPWPEFAEASLSDFATARRAGQSCDARLREAATHAPQPLDLGAPAALRRALEAMERDQ